MGPLDGEREKRRRGRQKKVGRESENKSTEACIMLSPSLGSSFYTSILLLLRS